jgi:Zinc carboxypeptidase
MVPAVTLAASLLLAGLSSLSTNQTANQTPAAPLPRWLFETWPSRRVLEQEPPCLRPADVEAALATLAERHGDRLRIEEVGRSVQGRPLRMLVLGTGEPRVLLFSQMHGDEPSATPALFDIADLLLSRPQRPDIARILEKYTLLLLPMVNPDGAEIYQRRNAQGIDINRDALALATPEGRALEAVRERHRPILAFNLHDQDRRTVVTDTTKLATIALLAVSGDRAQSETPSRTLALRACSAIARALKPLVGENMARYDEDWNPRAFGDNLTAKGTGTVLLESGGLTPGSSFSELTRLNFVAVLVVLAGLAENELLRYDYGDYQRLPLTASGGWVDIAMRGARLLQPSSSDAYRADLAFDLPRDDRALAQCPGAPSAPTSSSVVEVGDTRFFGAGRTVEVPGRLLVPALRAAVSGFEAQRWLDGGALERLARHGVATVSWQVDATHFAEALEWARSVLGSGRAQLEPSVAAAAEGAIVVTKAPADPTPGATLRSLVEGLGGATGAWQPAKPSSQAVLRPGAPASFLVLVPARPDDADPDPWEARLEAAWIDGVEHVAARSGG